MLIRHGNKIKLDSTHKWASKCARTQRGLYRATSTGDDRSSNPHKWKRGTRLEKGFFKTPMQACRDGKTGPSYLSHLREQPWETHTVINGIKFHPRWNW